MFDLYKEIKNTVSGLNDGLRIAVSNADNFTTPGYKYTYASFTTVFSRVKSGGTDKINPVEYPGSMTLGSTTTDFTQGPITFGTGMDVAIVGEGFIPMTNAANETGTSDLVYTRAGRFQVDFNNQFVVDSFGRKVFGFKVDANGNKISNDLVPIQTNGSNDVGFLDDGVFVSSYQKNKDDVKNGVASPTKTTPMYKLALTTFPNKQGLTLTQGGAWHETLASGQHLTAGASKEGSYGSIRGASLESSNIDVAKVALDLAILNRGFSAVQGVIDDVNKILSGLISKLQ